MHHIYLGEWDGAHSNLKLFDPMRDVAKSPEAAVHVANAKGIGMGLCKELEDTWK